MLLHCVRVDASVLLYNHYSSQREHISRSLFVGERGRRTPKQITTRKLLCLLFLCLSPLFSYISTLSTAFTRAGGSSSYTPLRPALVGENLQKMLLSFMTPLDWLNDFNWVLLLFFLLIALVGFVLFYSLFSSLFIHLFRSVPVSVPLRICFLFVYVLDCSIDLTILVRGHTLHLTAFD